MRLTFARIANCSTRSLGAVGGSRRLGELETIRAGVIAGLKEWKNRKNSGMVDAVAQSLADVTNSHFISQLKAVDEAIAQKSAMIQASTETRSSAEHQRQVKSWLASCWPVAGPDVLRSSAAVVAYAGLNPRQHQSGTSIDRVTRSPRSATPLFALRYTGRRCQRCDISRDRRTGGSVEIPRSPESQTDRRGGNARAVGAVLRRPENR